MIDINFKKGSVPINQDGTTHPTYKNGTTYDDYMGRWSEILAKSFIHFLPIKDGEEILDVGCGTGSLSKIIAENFNINRIVGIDPALNLLHHAHLKNTDPRLSFMWGLGEKIPIMDNQFDSSIALLALHNVPEPHKAVEEMMRVSRKGGLIAACEWDFSEGMEMFNILWETLIEIDPTAEKSHPKQIKLGRKGDLSGLWHKCGLTDIKSETINVVMEFKNFDDYLLPAMAGAQSAVRCLEKLSSDERCEFKEALRTQLLGNKNDGIFTLNARAWAVTGKVGGS